MKRRRPVIITTPMPTVYETADAMGVSRKRADEIVALVLGDVERAQPGTKKATRNSAKKRVVAKGSRS
jgi:hypothetical protein